MAYIIQRKDRFYVVAYDGIDPITGRERRRWHPAGHDRDEADQIAARLQRDTIGCAPPRGGTITLGAFLTDTWLPIKRRHVRASTGPFRALRASPSSSRSRPAPAAAASTSTTTPSPCSVDGGNGSRAKDSPTVPTTGCSATAPAGT
jgi:hypothetical protein